MDLGECMDQIERLFGLGRALDEVHRKVGEVLVNVSHLLRRLELIGDLQIAALLAFDDSVVFAQALEGFQPLGVEHQLRIFGKVHVLRVFADDRQEAAEFVVADILRLHPFGFTDMPLPGQSGDVTVLAQQLRGGDLVGPWVFRGWSLASRGRVRPLRAGMRPVINAAREGVQTGVA